MILSCRNEHSRNRLRHTFRYHEPEARTQKPLFVWVHCSVVANSEAREDLAQTHSNCEV